MPSLVSVVMAARNASPYIREAVKSILGQSYPYLELLVVDDASEDDTLDKLKYFSDGRMRIFSNFEALGAAQSRNRAIAEAKGDYILIMDADDISRKDRIRHKLDFLEKHPETDVAGSYIEMRLEPSGKTIKRKFPTTHEDIWAQSFFRFRIPHFCMLRRSYFDRLTYQPEWMMVEDYQLFWQGMVEGCHFALLPEVLYIYRIHEGQESSERAELRESQSLLFFKERLQWLGVSWTEDEIQFLHSFIRKTQAVTPDEAHRIQELLLQLLSFNNLHHKLPEQAFGLAVAHHLVRLLKGMRMNGNSLPALISPAFGIIRQFGLERTIRAVLLPRP